MTLSLESVRIRFGTRARVTVLTGPDRGREVVWTEGRVRIGTEVTCDLALTDPTVSYAHCAIELGPHGAAVHDLGSTNGTVVGGYRVESAYLHPGTIITLGRTQLRFDTDSAERSIAGEDRCGLLLGRSGTMRAMFDQLLKIAPTEATVLLTGETGTGKELLAETLHQASTRAHGPFVVIDCARVTPSLLDSELFGHVRGAYTGAYDDRIGAFESAHTGTVFLDEIGELPLELQPKLLRALERRTIRRVGSTHQVSIDVRVIAATHRDLAQDVVDGAFRADLYYRLNVFGLYVPPLRERRDDIPLLATHFFRQYTGDPRAELPADVMSAFVRNDWEGNVRELRSAIERWATLGQAPRFDTVRVSRDDDRPFKDVKAAMVESWERKYLSRLMQRHGGNVSRAARAVQMNRNYLTDLLRRYGVLP